MKNIVKRVGALLLTLGMIVSCAVFSLPTYAAADRITLQSTGNLNTALSHLNDGGTIALNGTLTLPSGFSWAAHGKNVTFTGGTLDASAISDFVINDHVTFENMTLVLKGNGNIYANGNSVTIAESVTVLNTPAAIYGGGKSGTTVASTDLTIMSGSYYKIFGGSHAGNITGDINLYVGGKTNSLCDTASHTGTYNIYGGNHGGATVGGDIHTTIADSAKANYIFGGGTGSGAAVTVGGTINLNVTGGTMMSIYGGNNDFDSQCNAHTVITGGTMEQVFGANQAANFTGDVLLQVFGGKITRRVYGGCYNEVTRSGFSANWHSSHHVIGNITLVIGSGANITLDATQYDDITIYAKTRYKTKIDTGACNLVYSDANAESTAKNGKTGPQDTKMSLVLSALFGGTNKPYDNKYTLSHSVNGHTITETGGTAAATATLGIDSSVSRVFTGSAIAPAVMTYGEGWLGETAGVLSYSNNVNAGTATTSFAHTRYGTVSASFMIEKAPQAAPVGLVAVAETVQSQADGRITGLTTAMEYSADGGATYTAVTDALMTLAPGTYKVRFSEVANYKASAEVTLTVASGRQVIDPEALTVRFQLPEADDASAQRTTLRLISSVDSTDYASVGFEMWIENSAGDMIEQDPLVTTKVFTSILSSNGETVTENTPSEVFCESSQYFFTQYLTGVPASYFNREILARAYVVTTDGYTVRGEMVTVTISQLFAAE